MAGTINIPLTTLAVGTRDFPPAGGSALADTDSEAVITVDRTVANGLNSATAATQLTISISQSNDGGGTWVELESSSAIGGVYTLPAKYGGGPVNQFVMGISLAPGTSRLVRAHIVVTGSSVAVQGSLVIS